MAFRSSNSATAGSGALTATPAGVVAGDVLIAVYHQDNEATPPDSSGTGPGSASWTLIATPASGNSFYVYGRIATGTDSFQAADNGQGGSRSLICGAWSGRDAASAFANLSVTDFSAGSSTTPHDENIVGLTAQAGDDLALFTGTNQDSDDTWNQTPPTGFTERRDINTADLWLNDALHTADAVSAGATGTLVVALTRTTGSSLGRLGGVLIAMSVVPTLEQEGFRVRNDDGSETTATWVDAQDTNVTRALSLATRIRLLLNATGNYASTAFMLEFKKSTATAYRKVPVPTTATVTWGDVGAGASGNTSATPAYPTGISRQTSKIYCLVTGRSDTANTAPTMPAGWTNVVDFEGGTGTWGVDAGTRRATLFRKNEVDGTETGTVTVSLAGNANNTLRTTIFRVEVPAGYDVAEATSSGADSSVGSGFSATGSSSIAFTPNDLLLIGVALAVDTATISSQAISASGITFGTRTNRQDVANGFGHDHRHILESVPVSSGTATSAPTWTATLGSATAGPAIFLRLRAIEPACVISPSSNITASGEPTTAQLSAPSGKTTSDFVAGRLQDDENPADAVDITADDYTELEWNLLFQSPAANGDVYTFRVVTANGSVIDTYTVTPQVTIGSGAGGKPFIHYQRQMAA